MASKHQESLLESIQVKQLRPNAPTNLAAGTLTATSVPLTWDATAGSGVTYRVYKDNVQVGTDMATTSYTVTGLTTLTTYEFEVTSVISTFESLRSNKVTVTTL